MQLQTEIESETIMKAYREYVKDANLTNAFELINAELYPKLRTVVLVVKMQPYRFLPVSWIYYIDKTATPKIVNVETEGLLSQLNITIYY